MLAVGQLADHSATSPAPPRDRSAPTQLAASVSGVPFPNYGAKLGWRASGTRTDELDGRETRTVYYARGDRRIAYSIVSGNQLAWPPKARRAVRDDTKLRYLRRGGRTVVTWRRRGHTCVLSGAGVSREELLKLAAWDGPAPA